MTSDSLYRVSLKCIIQNEANEVLVVQEHGPGHWSLPGGGMEHGEDFRAAIARELKEEVNLDGPFKYELLTIDSPRKLESRDVWQVRMVFVVTPDTLEVSIGKDAYEIGYMDIPTLVTSLRAYDEAVLDAIASLAR